MKSVSKSGVIRATKGKVILALLLACSALFLAWAVSRVAFKEMLDTVEHISSPNERLQIVNELSRKIAGLDQSQKKLAFNDPGKDNAFFKETASIRKELDTLRKLFVGDTLQMERIQSIHQLLAARDKQFVDYLKVRENLVHDQSFSSQLQKFNNMVTKNEMEADSTVVTSEKRTTTTTVVPSDDKPRGFFNKLFGKKKDDEQNEAAIRITNEENVKRDTIALSTEGKMVKGVEKTLRAMEKAQQQKSRTFIAREAVLAEANNLLIVQMLDILRKVEHEAVVQLEQNSIQAKNVVNRGINQMTIIMVVFFLLMVLLLFLILTDITRSNQYRKELEAATEEAEYHGKAKQRFLSNMSHEIRTPLQSIIGYAEIIRNQKRPDPKDIDAIYHSSEHLLQIVNEVLDYNRLISGKFTFVNQVFNIRELLDEVVKIVAPQAERKDLLMKTTFDLHGVEFLRGDPFRLKQILFNLLSNAIKFTMVGEVELLAFFKRQGDKVHFTFRVRDTGIGLSEAESLRIFNEFEQADAPEQPIVNQTGAGLGLSIVKSLVENQGGRIYVKSKKGQGSNFAFYLTFGIAKQPAAIAKVIPNALQTSENAVWVVDDDQLILDLCSLIFKKNNFNFKCFNSPQDMLDAEWDPAVKFLLMDIRMPKISGLELCKAMRLKVDQSVKIFAMTAQVLPAERESLLEGGFDGLIRKPFRENDLLDIFNREGGEGSFDAESENQGVEGLVKNESLAEDFEERSESEAAEGFSAHLSGDTEGLVGNESEAGLSEKFEERNESVAADGLVGNESEAEDFDDQMESATDGDFVGNRNTESLKDIGESEKFPEQSESAAAENQDVESLADKLDEVESFGNLIGDSIEEETLFDPSYLEKMTFGDQEQFNKILNRFSTDCQNDRNEILHCLKDKNTEQLSLLLHRLAGRLAQMGSRDLGMEFRLMEIKVNQLVASNLPLEDRLKKRVLQLCEKLNKLTQVVESAILLR